MNTSTDKPKKTRTRQSGSASGAARIAKVLGDNVSPPAARSSKRADVSAGVSKADATAVTTMASRWVLRVGQHLVLLFSESSLVDAFTVPRVFVVRQFRRVYLGAGPLNGAFGRSNGYCALLVASVPVTVSGVHIEFGSTGDDANGLPVDDVMDVDTFFESLATSHVALYKAALADMMAHLKTPQADLQLLLSRIPGMNVQAASVSSMETIHAVPMAVETAEYIQPPRTAAQRSSSALLQMLPPCPDSVRFHLSPIKDDTLEGWLWNAAAPEKRYEVQVWSGGMLVAYGKATEAAVGAQAAAVPVTDVGFRLSMPLFLRDGMTHTLEFRVAQKSTHETGFVLPETRVYQSDRLADSRPELLMLMDPQEDTELVTQLLEETGDSASRYLFSHVAPKLSLHLRNLEFPQSKALLDFASKSGSPHVYFVFKTGELLLLRAQWKKAVEVFSAVLKQAPGAAHACVALAHALHRQGLHDKATEALKLSLKLKPEHRGARLLLTKLECRKALDKATAKVNWDRLSDMLKSMWLRCIGDSEFEDLLLEVIDRQSGAVEQVTTSSASGDEYLALRKSRRLLQLAMTLDGVKPIQSRSAS